jgi:hypothetical protein
MHQDSLEYLEANNDLKELRWNGIHFVSIVLNLEGCFTNAEHYKRFIKHSDKCYILSRKLGDTQTVTE